MTNAAPSTMIASAVPSRPDSSCASARLPVTWSARPFVVTTSAPGSCCLIEAATVSTESASFAFTSTWVTRFSLVASFCSVASGK